MVYYARDQAWAICFTAGIPRVWRTERGGGARGDTMAEDSVPERCDNTKYLKSVLGFCF